MALRRCSPTALLFSCAAAVLQARPNFASFRCHQIGVRDRLGRQDLKGERPICLGDGEIGMEFVSSARSARQRRERGKRNERGKGNEGFLDPSRERNGLGNYFYLGPPFTDSVGADILTHSDLGGVTPNFDGGVQFFFGHHYHTAEGLRHHHPICISESHDKLLIPLLISCASLRS